METTRFTTLLPQLITAQKELASITTLTQLMPSFTHHLKKITQATGVTIEFIDPDFRENTFTQGQSCTQPFSLSMISIPVQNETNIIGVLKIYSPQADAFSETEKQAAQLLTEFFHQVFAALTSLQVARRILKQKSDSFSKRRHEIRNSLAGVVGMADLLLEMNLSPEERDCAQVIKDAGDAALVTLAETTDVTKSGRDVVQLEKMDFCLDHLLINVERTCSFALIKKDLNFFYETPPELLGACFHGDPNRLSILLTTFLNHAIQSTDRGHVAIAIKGEPLPNNQLNLCFEIIDTGRGETENASFICNRLIQVMGGEMQVVSTPGRGSTVYFSVPLPRVATPQKRAA